MISIIIPTMWFSDCLDNMVKKYDKIDEITEIIIIDNNVDGRRELQSDKITFLTTGVNLYVNPAWNWGVREAKEDIIIIANDDIIVADGVIENLDLKRGEILGADMNKGLWGFGTFMVMYKDEYLKIPEEMKIWFGDNLQLQNKTLRQINGIKTDMNTTINSINCFDIIEEDKNIWTRLLSS